MLWNPVKMWPFQKLKGKKKACFLLCFSPDDFASMHYIVGIIQFQSGKWYHYEAYTFLTRTMIQYDPSKPVLPDEVTQVFKT